ncbi:MAG: hypothetical protein ACOZAR_03170 [Patescibacteria group bacterium]
MDTLEKKDLYPNLSEIKENNSVYIPAGLSEIKEYIKQNIPTIKTVLNQSNPQNILPLLDDKNPARHQSEDYILALDEKISEYHQKLQKSAEIKSNQEVIIAEYNKNTENILLNLKQIADQENELLEMLMQKISHDEHDPIYCEIKKDDSLEADEFEQTLQKQAVSQSDIILSMFGQISKVVPPEILNRLDITNMTKKAKRLLDNPKKILSEMKKNALQKKKKGCSKTMDLRISMIDIHEKIISHLLLQSKVENLPTGNNARLQYLIRKKNKQNKNIYDTIKKYIQIGYQYFSSLKNDQENIPETRKKCKTCVTKICTYIDDILQNQTSLKDNQEINEIIDLLSTLHQQSDHEIDKVNDLPKTQIKDGKKIIKYRSKEISKLESHIQSMISSREQSLQDLAESNSNQLHQISLHNDQVFQNILSDLDSLSDFLKEKDSALINSLVFPKFFSESTVSEKNSSAQFFLNGHNKHKLIYPIDKGFASRIEIIEKYCFQTLKILAHNLRYLVFLQYKQKFTYPKPEIRNEIKTLTDFQKQLFDDYISLMDYVNQEIESYNLKHQKNIPVSNPHGLLAELLWSTSHMANSYFLTKQQNNPIFIARPTSELDDNEAKDFEFHFPKTNQNFHLQLTTIKKTCDNDKYYEKESKTYRHNVPLLTIPSWQRQWEKIKNGDYLNHDFLKYNLTKPLHEQQLENPLTPPSIKQDILYFVELLDNQ